MKTAPAIPTHGWMNPAQPLAANRSAASISDGDGLQIGTHRLGIALSQSGLETHRRQAGTTHWVLPLERSEVATGAPELRGEVFWISLQTPGAMLGPLVDEIRGARVEGDAIVVNLDGNPRILPLDSGKVRELTLLRLAREVASLWVEQRGGTALLPVLLPRIASENPVPATP